MRPLDALFEFLSIPSVSTDPAHKEDVRRAAFWLKGRLEALGFQVEVAETPGHPVVFAEKRVSAQAPTLLIYGHYDVQPPEPLELWETPPFAPTLKEGRIYARGASDDKGQIYAHIAAVEALGEALGVNVKFLIEGEEEIGSPHLPDFVRENRDRLEADVILVSDGAMFAPKTPTLTYGLRGLVYLEVLLEGAARDLHSGVYGGAAPNPLQALGWMVAQLKGEDHRVRIPGFYDDVVPLTDADRAALAELPFDEEAYRVSLGVPALVGESGYTTLERRGARPTLDVNGIWGGFAGEGPKTIIPASAHAKVSCRLVANQDPDRIYERFTAFVGEVAPPGVRVAVRYLGGGRPTLTPIDHPATQAAARALEATFGRRPLYIREGGSIPVAASFATLLGLPVVLLGFAPPDGNVHAPNEWMDLDNYEGGIRAVVRFFDELAGAAS
ncbi:MAG: dipeptidase [Thermus sp.]